MKINKLAEMMQCEFGVVNNKIGGLEKKMNEKFDRVDERFNEVLGREDKIFKRLDNLETDNMMGAGASRRQEDKLENHEERIVVVEEKLGIGETV